MQYEIYICKITTSFCSERNPTSVQSLRVGINIGQHIKKPLKSPTGGLILLLTQCAEPNIFIQNAVSINISIHFDTKAYIHWHRLIFIHSCLPLNYILFIILICGHVWAPITREQNICVCFFFFFKFCSFCILCPSLTWWTHTPHPSLLPHYIPFSFSKVPVFCSSHRLPLWLFYPKCICSSFWIHCLAGLWQIRTTVCNRGGLGCFCIPLGVSVSLSRLTSLPSPVASLSLSIFLTLCLN